MSESAYKESEEILKEIVGLTSDDYTKTITMTPHSFACCIQRAQTPKTLDEAQAMLLKAGAFITEHAGKLKTRRIVQ